MFGLSVATPAIHSLALRRRTHEVTEVFVKFIVAIERYLEPEDLVTANSAGSSDSTFSDDGAGPSVEVPKLAPESADAEPLEEADASSASPYARWEGGGCCG
eukprot:6214618-Pleurochrysis_carterae.AAC.2